MYGRRSTHTLVLALCPCNHNHVEGKVHEYNPLFARTVVVLITYSDDVNCREGHLHYVRSLPMFHAAQQLQKRSLIRVYAVFDEALILGRGGITRDMDVAGVLRQGGPLACCGAGEAEDTWE